MFTEPVPGINVTIRQVSPFIPHSYSETSFPTCCFHVDVENVSYKSSEIDVSVMFSFENGYDVESARSDDNGNEITDKILHGPFSVNIEDGSGGSRVVGVCMTHTKHTKIKGKMIGGIWCPLGSQKGKDVHFADQGSFAIATSDDHDSSDGSDVSFAEMMYVENSKNAGNFSFFSANRQESATSSSKSYYSAKDVWDSFHNTGHLNNNMGNVEKQTVASNGHRRVAACICKHKTMKPLKHSNSNSNMLTYSFALSWDHPIARFGSGMSVPRYYTRFFGDSGYTTSLIFSMNNS